MHSLPVDFTWPCGEEMGTASGSSAKMSPRRANHWSAALLPTEWEIVGDGAGGHTVRSPPDGVLGILLPIFRRRADYRAGLPMALDLRLFRMPNVGAQEKSGKSVKRVVLISSLTAGVALSGLGLLGAEEQQTERPSPVPVSTEIARDLTKTAETFEEPALLVDDGVPELVGYGDEGLAEYDMPDVHVTTAR